MSESPLKTEILKNLSATSGERSPEIFKKEFTPEEFAGMYAVSLATPVENIAHWRLVPHIEVAINDCRANVTGDLSFENHQKVVDPESLVGVPPKQVSRRVRYIDKVSDHGQIKIATTAINSAPGVVSVTRSKIDSNVSKQATLGLASQGVDIDQIIYPRIKDPQLSLSLYWSQELMREGVRLGGIECEFTQQGTVALSFKGVK